MHSPNLFENSHVAPAKKGSTSSSLEAVRSGDLGLVVRLRSAQCDVRVMMETLTREIADQRGVRILRIKIPAEARFLEAEAFGQPVGEYDAAARSAVAFRSLADEVQSMVAALGAVA